MQQNTNASAGAGFFTLLGVAFIVMKLCGVINWSWLWVLAPLWVPLAIVGILIIIVIAIGMIKDK